MQHTWSWPQAKHWRVCGKVILRPLVTKLLMQTSLNLQVIHVGHAQCLQQAPRADPS
jgi:hypothetical protein